MSGKLLNLRYAVYILLTGIMLSSCSKDDTKTDNIIGTWTAGSSTMTAMVGTKTITEYFVDVAGLTAEEAALYVNLIDQALKQAFTGSITIKADKTYTSNLGGSDDSGTWSLNSDRSELTMVSAVDGPMTYDVVELTSSKLKLHIEETVSEDLNGDDIDELISVTADVTLNQ
ncbi:MAG: DUF4923 family protein [Bacteroidales bacterium]|nr:DUF4923 family protein [Bacteroidales bacterium]MBK8883338.1 DUF4923 family protein [Bacteroidales bacterium]